MVHETKLNLSSLLCLFIVPKGKLWLDRNGPQDWLRLVPNIAVRVFGLYWLFWFYGEYAVHGIYGYSGKIKLECLEIH